MNIFRFLSKKPAKPGEPPVPQKLVDDIRLLMKTPEWGSHKTVLDIFINTAMKQLLGAGDNDAEVHRLRGYIQGLMHSVQLSEQLVSGDDSDRQRNQRINAADELRAATAASGLFATGYWGH